MTDYRCDLTLPARADDVFAAVATIPGLRGWWIGDAPVDGEDAARIGWSPSSFTVLRLDRLVRPREVEWTCVAQHDENLPSPDEWVGTRLSFRLAEDGDATRLSFVHRGLAPRLACYDRCEGGWEFFLRRSLAALVTTGCGVPQAVGEPGGRGA